MSPRHSLNKIRQQVADDLPGFKRAIGGTAFKKRFDGLTDDEPGVKLTLMPSLIDRAMKDYALIVPLCRWLNNALGYPRAKTR